MKENRKSPINFPQYKMIKVSVSAFLCNIIVIGSCLMSLIQLGEWKIERTSWKSVELIFFLLVSSNKFTTSTIHKTKDALEVKSDLHCYTCDILTDPDSCINILNVTDSERVKYTRKCDSENSFCTVRRYSYTMTDKDSTSEKRLWSLTRNCTDHCENGCIIIGERVKLHACSSCCNSSFCNVGNHSPSWLKVSTVSNIVIVLLSSSLAFSSFYRICRKFDLIQTWTNTAANEPTTNSHNLWEKPES